MDHLPHDPAMLVSCINMLLRDHEYESFDELCYNFDKEPKALLSYLASCGYVYSQEQNQLRPEGYDAAAES
jgi:hypothetical protein